MKSFRDTGQNQVIFIFDKLTKIPNLKKKKKTYFFFFAGGGGGGSELFWTKNPNLKNIRAGREGGG